MDLTMPNNPYDEVDWVWVEDQFDTMARQEGLDKGSVEDYLDAKYWFLEGYKLAMREVL
jgi:hypothetical protein